MDLMLDVAEQFAKHLLADIFLDLLAQEYVHAFAVLFAPQEMQLSQRLVEPLDEILPCATHHRLFFPVTLSGRRAYN